MYMLDQLIRDAIPVQELTQERNEGQSSYDKQLRRGICQVEGDVMIGGGGTLVIYHRELEKCIITRLKVPLSLSSPHIVAG